MKIVVSVLPNLKKKRKINLKTFQMLLHFLSGFNFYVHTEGFVFLVLNRKKLEDRVNPHCSLLLEKGDYVGIKRK